MTQYYSYKNLGKAGRLGNQLFEIAWTYAQARLNNGEACVVPDWEYKDFFSIPEFMYQDAPDDSVDGGLEFYQDISLWHDYGSEIWNLFQPSELAINIVEDKFVDLPEIAKNGCSVHYRRGDYLKYPTHYPLPTLRYYRRAMERALERNPDTHFWVFSDSIDQVRKMYDSDHWFAGLDVTFVDGDVRPTDFEDRVGVPMDWVDMFGMSFCSQNIIANSTFSWWGAFLGAETKVYYPSKWYGTHPSVRKIPWRKMIPEGWEEIAC